MTPPSSERPRQRRDRRQRVRPVHPAAAPFIKRAIPPYEMLDEEQLRAVELQADRLLEEIGMEIRGDHEAIRLWREAGAQIERDTRVRVPTGLARATRRRTKGWISPA